MYRLGWVFFLLAAAWALQLVLSLYQSRRFHRALHMLKKDGDKTSVGVNGSTWRRRVYAVLVVDKSRKIVHARKMAGFTVFADLEPVHSLQGMPLSYLQALIPPQGISKKIWGAFRNAAAFIPNTEEEQTEDTVVMEEETLPQGYSVNSTQEKNNE